MASSICSPAARVARMPNAGHRSARTAASASRPAITGSTRASWSTWRASRPRRSSATMSCGAARSNISPRWRAARARSRGCCCRPKLWPGSAGHCAPQTNMTSAPEIVFYTGCNVIKTPHIALLGAGGARRARRALRGHGRQRDVLRHPAVQARRREDRGKGVVQHDRAPLPSRRVARRRLVSELPDPDGGDRAAGLSRIVWRRRRST